MEDLKTILTQEKPLHLMRRYALPCIISLLVAALYNIVDQIFIANASYLGSYGNSANTVVYPLTVAALSIAVMIGDGCCAFISISSGAGRDDDTHRAAGNAIGMAVVSSLIITALYLIFQDQILTAFGARVSDETFRLSKEYFFWITLGIPFYMFGQAMNPVIRSDGSPKFAMFATLVGCVINIICDPIFIYPMHMGMMGAAVATVLGQIATAVLSIYYLLHMHTMTLRKESFRPSGRIMRKSLFLGMTSFLSQISVVCSMLVIQNMVMKYGALDPIYGQEQYAQIPMAVLGIVMKVFQITISVSVGIAAGMIPVIGYNIGAQLYKRSKEMFKLVLKAEFILGCVALVIVEVFPHQLIQLFGAANESQYYTDFAVKCFRTYLMLMPLATVNKGVFISMQALGKARESTLLSCFREIVLGCGLALLLPVWFGLDGVLYSMPASDFIAFIITFILIIRTLKELDAGDQKLYAEQN
jgi:putative MATE family efflux protein